MPHGGRAELGADERPEVGERALAPRRPISTSSAMAPTLSTVNRFCTNAPASTPRQLTHVRSAMIADRDQLRARQREEAELEQQVVLAEVQPDAAEELGERDRHRRVEPALDDEEDRPAVEEPDERPEGLAQKDVLAAGLGHHRAQLAVGERAEQRQRAADEPQAEVDAGRADEPGHDRRRDEDARADHRAHDQRRGAEDPEAPLQRLHGYAMESAAPRAARGSSIVDRSLRCSCPHLSHGVRAMATNPWYKRRKNAQRS